MTVRVWGPSGRWQVGSAAQAVAALGGSPGTIVLSPGAHASAPVVLGAGQVLRGAGRAVTTLKTSVTFASNSSVRDLTVQGTGTGTGITAATNSARWVCRDVTVENFTTGVSLSDTWIGTFADCIVQGNSDVGYLWASGSVNAITVRGGEVKGSDRGVVFRVGNKPTFDGVAIEGNTTGGLHLETTTHALTVRDCYFEANGTYDLRTNQAGRALAVRDNQFLGSTPLNMDIVAALGAVVENNWCNPSGDTPKALVVGQFATDVWVGRNTWVRGAFDSQADDSGTNTVVAA